MLNLTHKAVRPTNAPEGTGISEPPPAFELRCGGLYVSIQRFPKGWLVSTGTALLSLALGYLARH
ncbi:hypothetical protein [Kitasatospora viridis]|uniref:Uncharacterized protein n=1 Tax=Kitasatospora viridis TaxID=281105 RepID=A0A561TTE3_9ACTN|nr:hypothetical protein [Kitasatospora viridis]TWF90379.1 hypothetical protein FHX73_13423 [Kitasatospora viridis]